MAHISGRMTCSSFYVTVFPNGLILGRIYTYIMESQLAVSFGRVVGREMKHPGEKASGHQSASGKEAPRHPGGESPERSWTG